MRWSLLLPLALPLVGACFGEKDETLPGESLGEFHVVATLESSTCGPGALGSTDVWEFDVQLAQDDDYLYWMNGSEAIEGSLASDGRSFSFGSQTRVPVVAATKTAKGCTVVRTDAASGALEGSDRDIPAFTGRIRYGYTAETGSDCTELLGTEGGLAGLPCEIDYRLAATRTAEPAD